MFLLDIATYLASFFVIWAGTGLIVTSIERVSKKLRVSSFAVSFFVLGFLTSTPEFAVGLTSIAEGTPEIFIGNLLGGIIILFLLVIPTFAILSNGVKLKSELDRYTIAFCLFVIGTPALLIFDARIGLFEGILLILLYIMLFYFVQRKKGFLDRENSELLKLKAYSLVDMAKVIIGVGLVFASSTVIVDKTIYFADIMNVSPFYVSLIGLSLGTNLPELTIGIRAAIAKKRDIAFGDYLGSASVNTFLFGLFSLLTGTEIVTANGFYLTFAFITSALLLFFYFTKSKNDLSKKEGYILLLLYIAFLTIEILRQQDLHLQEIL